MARIHNYNSFSGLEKLKEIVAEQDPAMSEELMKALFPFRDKNIGETLDKIISRFESSANYNTPKEWFTQKEFNTFMDYFQRKLTKKKTEEIESGLNQFTMVMPAEANIEAIGDFTDTEQILRLKQPTNNVLQDLRNAGISNIDNMEFISLKLLKCYYHRVHCPVNGIIQDIVFIGRENPLFGHNSLWIVSLSSEHGMVYMLLVGELSIQDFTFNMDKGATVKKFDELGHFNWGSQLVLIYERDSFRGDVLLEEKQKYFVGDGIFSNIKVIDPTEWGSMPNTQFTRNDLKTGLTLGTGETGPI